MYQYQQDCMKARVQGKRERKKETKPCREEGRSKKRVEKKSYQTRNRKTM